MLTYRTLYISDSTWIDVQPLIEWLWSQGKQTIYQYYTPFSDGHLLFLHLPPTTPTVLNKYGIVVGNLQPINVGEPLSATSDLILTPLCRLWLRWVTACMGGGYYDRTLAKWFFCDRRRCNSNWFTTIANMQWYFHWLRNGTFRYLKSWIE